MYFAFLAADLVDRMLESGLPARRVLHDMDRVSPYRFPMTFPGLGWSRASGSTTPTGCGSSCPTTSPRR